MLQQFKSMNELEEYLGTLEERLRKIEVENRILRETPPSKDPVDANAIVKSVLRSFPRAARAVVETPALRSVARFKSVTKWHESMIRWYTGRNLWKAGQLPNELV